MKTTCVIVDDEKLARDLLREYLEGFPDIDIVAECAKGSEAVEQVNRLKPDLLFLDVQMPGMNGLEVARLIRQNESGRISRTPIVGFTAHVGTKILYNCRETGMDLVLYKPVEIEELYAAIDQLLAG